jgi:hypothetical protein
MFRSTPARDALGVRKGVSITLCRSSNLKILLSCFSFALFAFLYFGVVLHTSEGAQFLGKYSAKYMLVVVAVTFAALPWAWATRSLVSESEVTLRSGRMFVIRPQHKVLFYSSTRCSSPC